MAKLTLTRRPERPQLALRLRCRDAVQRTARRLGVTVDLRREVAEQINLDTQGSQPACERVELPGDRPQVRLNINRDNASTTRHLRHPPRHLRERGEVRRPRTDHRKLNRPRRRRVRFDMFDTLNPGRHGCYFAPDFVPDRGLELVVEPEELDPRAAGVDDDAGEDSGVGIASPPEGSSSSAAG